MISAEILASGPVLSHDKKGLEAKISAELSGE